MREVGGPVPSLTDSWALTEPIISGRATDPRKVPGGAKIRPVKRAAFKSDNNTKKTPGANSPGVLIKKTRTN